MTDLGRHGRPRKNGLKVANSRYGIRNPPVLLKFYSYGIYLFMGQTFTEADPYL